VSLESRAAISSLRLDGQKQDAFFAPVELCSAGFAESDQRLYVTVAHLLGDVRIERDAASQESARPWD